MSIIARFLFENSDWLSPFESCWWAGFCLVGADGKIYLTDAGEEYLAGLAP
jgi:hypothetical protein